jgi:hypothetical protein
MARPVHVLMPCLAFVCMTLAPAVAQEAVSFHTPSDNIYCYGEVSGADTTIDCELLSQTNPKPLLPVPADCEQEWGSRFALKDGGTAFMVCAGDTLRSNDAMNLPYGKQLDFYGIACTATERYLECVNDDGHGFKISKAKQAMY